MRGSAYIIVLKCSEPHQPVHAEMIRGYKARLSAEEQRKNAHHEMYRIESNSTRRPDLPVNISGLAIKVVVKPFCVTSYHTLISSLQYDLQKYQAVTPKN